MEKRFKGIPLGPPKRRRAGLLDEWRGLALVCMLVYHTCYDLYAMFGVPLPLYSSPAYVLLQRFIGYSFILISGIACSYSRSNLKRGVVTFGLAMVMTGVTALVMPDQLILFGVLHFLGVSMMLAALLMPVLEKIPLWPGVIGSLFLFVCTFPVYSGRIGIGALTLELPGVLFQGNLLFPLGFHNAEFFSSDYYPLLPWFFLFLTGVFWGRSWRGGRMPEFVYRTHIPALAAMGRHTNLVYLVHQPVIYGLMTLLFQVI